MIVNLLRGPSGSGKSTYIKNKWPKAPNDSALIFSTDSYFLVHPPENDEIAELAGPTYRFDASKLREAHSACLCDFVLALHNKVPLIIVDNTFIRLWEIEPYIKIAQLAKAQITVYEFVPDTVAEIRLCADRNIHNVPIDIICRHSFSFEQLPDDEDIEVFPMTVK